MDVVIHSDAGIVLVKGAGATATLGVVARDTITREVIFYASGICLDVSRDPNEAELISILLGVYLANCLGIRKLHVRTDAKTAVDVLGRSRSNVPAAMLELFDAYEILATGDNGERLVQVTWIEGYTEGCAAHALSHAPKSDGAYWDDFIVKFWTYIESDQKSRWSFTFMYVAAFFLGTVLLLELLAILRLREMPVTRKEMKTKGESRKKRRKQEKKKKKGQEDKDINQMSFLDI